MSLARFLSQMRADEHGDPLPTVRWFGLRLTLVALFVGLTAVAVGFWCVLVADWLWGAVT